MIQQIQFIVNSTLIPSMTAVVITLAVLLSAINLVSANTLTVFNCSDRAFCASGCVSTQLPADICLPMSEGGSQILSCNPFVTVCGDLSYFSDPQCSNLMFTDGFVCDRCNRDHTGNFSLITCMRKNGVESLGLNHCGTSCGTCNNFFNLTQGTCIPIGSGDSQLLKFVTGRRKLATEFSGTFYARYTGSSTCTGIVLNQWLGVSGCTGSPTQTPELPENSCIDGLRLSCQF